MDKELVKKINIELDTSTSDKLNTLILDSIKNTYLPTMAAKMHESIPLRHFNKIVTVASALYKFVRFATKGNQDEAIHYAGIEWRFYKKIIFLANEIRMLLEQGYEYSALAASRRIMELQGTYEVFVKSTDIEDTWKKMLFHGNYQWWIIDKIFKLNETKETNEFDKSVKKMFTDKELKNPNGWMHKNHPGKTPSNFYLDRYKDTIYELIYNSTHKVIHAGSYHSSINESNSKYEAHKNYVELLAILTTTEAIRYIFEYVNNAKNSKKEYEEIMFIIKSEQSSLVKIFESASGEGKKFKSEE